MEFHPFPKFMEDKNFTESQKIILFNHFVAKIEKEENPDLIIIGIPGGVAKINNVATNDFGIFAYEVSQAVTPDVVVFSTFYEEFTNDYYSRINNLVKYKLGYEIDCFNLANTKFDWEISYYSKEEVFLTLSSQFIDTKIANSNLEDVTLFNILNIEDSEKMYTFITSRFEEYSEIEII
jgi:peptide maturation system protein (TIGR04066 family)